MFFYAADVTQISKRYIPPWTYEKILDIFLSSFLRIRDKNTSKRFFEEFLTPTEKVMLAKRITGLYLLFKNVSILETAEILKLSTSTVAKYSYFLKRNTELSNIFAKILGQENFLKLIDTIINEFIQPPGSIGTHWASAGKAKIAYEQRKRSPL